MKKTLTELADIYYGKSPSEIRTEYSLIPIYGTGGLVGWASKPLFDKSGIIVGRKGTLGRPILSENPFWAIDTTYAVIPKEGVNIKWLYFNLLKYDLTRLNEATGVPSINRDLLSSIGLEYFPENQQAEIANVLCAVDNALEKNETLLSKITELKKALMQELFTKGIGHKEFKNSPLGRIPKTWNISIMTAIARVIDSMHQTPKFSVYGYPMVRVSDIKEGHLDLTNTVKVDEMTFTTFIKNHTPTKGNIVMSRVGSYGVSSYVNTNAPFCMGQNTVVIESKIQDTFLYYALNSAFVKKQIESESYGTGYKSLSLKSIRELKIPVPPSDEQEQIASILSSNDLRMSAIRDKIKNLGYLKQALMQDLLSGKVRVKAGAPDLAGATK